MVSQKQHIYADEVIAESARNMRAIGGEMRAQQERGEALGYLMSRSHERLKTLKYKKTGLNKVIQEDMELTSKNKRDQEAYTKKLE